MTDETVVLQEDATAETTEKATDTQQSNKGKSFTQEEVNRLIAKEKVSWKKSADNATSTLDESITTLRKDLSDRDEVIQETLNLLKKDLGIDNDEWEADFGDRDILWQYRRLLEKSAKGTKKDILRTPHGEGERIPASSFTRRNSV